MAKTHASRRGNSVWPLSYYRNNHKSYFGKYHLARYNPFSFLTSIAKGFSLIELIVVIGMLAILFTVMVGVLNPITQINKAKDTQREHEIDQIKTAVDTYYSDTGCYPLTVPFNTPFLKGNAIYLKKVPQDPNCSASSTSSCYLYETDITSSCPQWSVLYVKLTNLIANGNKVFCPLTQINNCLATNYTSLGYNYCTLSGNIDCNYIHTNPLPSPIFLTPTPTALPSGAPTIYLSPTPIPTCVPGYSSLNYACYGSPLRCDVVPAGQGTYCGFPGCTGGACCFNQCL